MSEHTIEWQHWKIGVRHGDHGAVGKVTRTRINGITGPIPSVFPRSVLLVDSAVGGHLDDIGNQRVMRDGDGFRATRCSAGEAQ